MPVELEEEEGGKILTINVSGKLTKADYERFVPEMERLIQQHGKLRLLFNMTDFHGWDASAAWEDLKFGIKHLSDIERLAMVGEQRWQEGMTTFCKPFFRASIRYFDHTEVDEARKWLNEA
ncbi:MAG TPA: STAS/SEC14 domain-containing protein [Armatimonadota bacterium]|nr:STAS/SEC14 domain-containing protein [Armatimonadota bacterium]